MGVVGSAAAEAEDVVQDTWLRAAAALQNFRGDSSFGTWLCGIGLNASLEQLRRGGRVSAREHAIGQMEFAGRPQSSDDRMDLDCSIARLPNGCRTVLVLNYVEGFTQ